MWTPAQIDQACDLHRQCRNITRITAELGLSRSTTRRLLVRGGEIASTTDETADRRREQLIPLVRHLRAGKSLADAAAASALDVQQARSLIRIAAELVPEPLSKALQRQAAEVRDHLQGDDVRAAALAVGVDPWWALFLLVSTGSEPLSMQPQRQAEGRERAARMAARRAEGATFDQIALEYGVTRERVRRLLIATGAWKPARGQPPRRPARPPVAALSPGAPAPAPRRC